MAEGTGKRPFWMHQAVEYLLGGALVATGLQSPTPIVPAAVGGLIMLHAAITRGPLSAFRWVGRRTHRVIDVGIIAIEVLAALQVWISVEAGARIIMVGVAVVHTFVWWQSSYTTKVKSPKVAPTLVEGDRSADMGRTAGRAVGNGVNAVKRAAEKRRS